MKTIAQIEVEAAEWRDRNFAGSDVPFFDSHQQLIGMTEEIGELWLAQTKKDQADALGDLMIYMMGYCQRRGWSLGEILSLYKAGETTGSGILVGALGRLAHAELKFAQQIRLNEDHNFNAKVALADIVAGAERWAVQYLSKPLEEIVNETWEHVGQRNWIADPITGGQ